MSFLLAYVFSYIASLFSICDPLLLSPVTSLQQNTNIAQSPSFYCLQFHIHVDDIITIFAVVFNSILNMFFDLLFSANNHFARIQNPLQRCLQILLYFEMQSKIPLILYYQFHYIEVQKLEGIAPLHKTKYRAWKRAAKCISKKTLGIMVKH